MSSPDEINLMIEKDPRSLKEIGEGHGMTDISCKHGSRWIWWYPTLNKGKWENVVLHCRCDCGKPPRPFKPKSLPLRIRKPYFDAIVAGDKLVEYRKDSEFWSKRIRDAETAVFMCGKKVHRRKIVEIIRMDTPEDFSEQGMRDVDTPTCLAIYLGDEIT